MEQEGSKQKELSCEGGSFKYVIFNGLRFMWSRAGALHRNARPLIGQSNNH